MIDPFRITERDEDLLGAFRDATEIGLASEQAWDFAAQSRAEREVDARGRHDEPVPSDGPLI
jgi:hypothetical protein